VYLKTFLICFFCYAIPYIIGSMINDITHIEILFMLAFWGGMVYEWFIFLLKRKD
jgi:hypothetical protein